MSCNPVFTLLFFVSQPLRQMSLKCLDRQQKKAVTQGQIINTDQPVYTSFFLKMNALSVQLKGRGQTLTSRLTSSECCCQFNAKSCEPLWRNTPRNIQTRLLSSFNSRHECGTYGVYKWSKKNGPCMRLITSSILAPMWIAPIGYARVPIYPHGHWRVSWAQLCQPNK